MHILVIPSWYSTPKNPIRGSFFREQALALQRAGHQVGLLVPPSKLRTWNGLAEVRRNWRNGSDALTVYDDEGMATYRIPWWGWWPSVYPAAREGLVLRAYDRYAAEQGTPDVIHAHSLLYAGVASVFVKQHRQVPVVLTENSTTFVRRLIFPDQMRRVRAALKAIDRAFAVNPIQARVLQSYVPDKTIELIQNSTNIEFFRPPAVPPPDAPFVYSVIANLHRRKGLHILLPAFKQAFAGENVHLQVIGDGTSRARLERLTQKLDLQAQVRFLGQLPRAGVRDAIQRSHAVVSASYFEMLPFNLIEALACGRPIVATRSGGADVLVNERNGLLVPTGDVDALAAALRQMRDTYPQYDTAAIRAETVATYSDDALVARLTGIYEGLAR
jgi:glycosyltransferase involved in cell wall biosynthesis